jgi:hypothetical protein
MGGWQVDNPAIIGHRRLTEECDVIAIFVKQLELMNTKKSSDAIFDFCWRQGHCGFGLVLALL